MLKPPPAVCQGDELYCWAAGGASFLRATGINPSATRDSLVIRFGGCLDDEGALPENYLDEVFLDMGANITRHTADFDYDFVKETLQQSGHFLLLIGGSFTGHTLVVYAVGVGPDGKPSKEHFSVMDPADCTYQNRSFSETTAAYLGTRTKPGPRASCR